MRCGMAIKKDKTIPNPGMFAEMPIEDSAYWKAPGRAVIPAYFPDLIVFHIFLLYDANGVKEDAYMEDAILDFFCARKLL